MRLSQLTTERDRLEAERISRRRLLERQRKNRIFDTKSRIFGLDCAALDEQVAEKERMRDAEKRREIEYAELDRKKGQEVAEIERLEEEERRNNEEEINLFRQTNQRKNLSREFDLNDKDMLKKDKVPRASDSDPASVSGAQKFAGEDLSHAERMKAQKEEQRLCLQRQMEEKRREAASSKLRDRDIFTALIASAQQETEIEALNNARKNELTRQNAEFNQNLAKERMNKRRSDRVAEEADNLAEIYNLLSSDILTENPETAKSALGRNRKVQYMYRGMSKAEVEEYRQDQLRQQQDTLRKLNAGKRNERAWEETENQNYRRIELEERQRERMNKNEALDLKEENQRLAILQSSENKELEKKLSENQPTDQYFQQFNTTSR